MVNGLTVAGERQASRHLAIHLKKRVADIASAIKLIEKGFWNWYGILPVYNEFTLFIIFKKYLLILHTTS